MGPAGPQGLQGVAGPTISAVSSVSNLTQSLEAGTIVFDTAIPGWTSQIDVNITGFIVPVTGLYLINYSINGVALLKRNGIDVPGINSVLVELTSGDVISLYGLSAPIAGPSASIIFIKLN